MKKILLVSTLLLMALVAGAQTKVAPKMQKGTKKVYVSELTTNLPGQKEVTITCESQYEVTDVTADGYILDMVTTNVQTNADANDVVGRILSLSTEMLKGGHVLFATDKDGKVVKILNYDELKKGTQETLGKIIDGLQLPEMLSKDMLTEQMMGSLTEETLLQSVQMNTSPLALNGKTIATGAQDEYRNEQGLKMKRMYFLNNDGSIMTTATMNMSKEEMKQMVIAQVEKVAPDQAEMVKQNIDMLINNNMLKMEASEKATYTLQADGWVGTIKTEVTSETMGQKTSVQTTVRQQ